MTKIYLLLVLISVYHDFSQSLSEITDFIAPVDNAVCEDCCALANLEDDLACIQQGCNSQFDDGTSCVDLFASGSTR